MGVDGAAFGAFVKMIGRNDGSSISPGRDALGVLIDREIRRCRAAPGRGGDDEKRAGNLRQAGADGVPEVDLLVRPELVHKGEPGRAAELCRRVGADRLIDGARLGVNDPVLEVLHPRGASELRRLGDDAPGFLEGDPRLLAVRRGAEPRRASMCGGACGGARSASRYNCDLFIPASCACWCMWWCMWWCRVVVLSAGAEEALSRPAVVAVFRCKAYSEMHRNPCTGAQKSAPLHHPPLSRPARPRSAAGLAP